QLPVRRCGGRLTVDRAVEPRMARCTIWRLVMFSVWVGRGRVHGAGTRVACMSTVPARRTVARAVAFALGLGALMPLATFAQTTSTSPGSSAQSPSKLRLLPTIVVTGTRVPGPEFDVPASVTVVSGNHIRNGPPGSNLASTLARVPGLVAQDRQSLAQDLQLSLRGFGARASFGVTGIRLMMDGLPYSDPDGQGETDPFDLAAAQRIEVLRGPFSVLYGNAAGGVIQVG